MVVLKVVAVAARQLDRAKTFAENHKIPKFYGSYEELAKDGNVGKSTTRLIILEISSFIFIVDVGCINSIGSIFW